MRDRDRVSDLDSFRLIEYAYPETLDTAILWTGFDYVNGSKSELQRRRTCLLLAAGCIVSHTGQPRELRGSE